MREWDRLTRIEKEQKLIAQLEAQYRYGYSTRFSRFTAWTGYGTQPQDRHGHVGQTGGNQDYLPTVIRPDNPETPYDDSDIVPSVTLSSETSTTRWRGADSIPKDLQS